MGCCCPEDDFGRAIGGWGSGARWAHGDEGCWLKVSLPPSGADMVGATREERSAKTALLRLDVEAFPVCCANSAFFFAIAAAASGNIALMVEESRPEFRLALGEGGIRPSELRELSTFNFDMASLKRLDMGSEERSVAG
jgi:hypothetical protein